jgi:AraC-like DNA-binding protein
MDPLADLLDGPRARNAFLLRSVLDPPWALRIQDEAPLTLVTVVSGAAWIVLADRDPVGVTPGDVAILRGPDPYTVADDPATVPQVIIHPGQRCETLDGEPLDQAMDLGVRTWGNSAEGETVMLTGTYEFAGEISRRLLRALPPLLVLEAGHSDATLTALLAAEIVKDEPGQEAVLDRILDLLLISTLRAWFSRPEGQAPAWYRAQSDPVVGAALRMLQNNPAHPWSVASLAQATHVSRAALARRFNELVGEPPMTFLTGWRLDLAADLLCETDATISAVAEQVGYGSPFALSTAFKRVLGVSPQQHRRRSRALAS